MILEFLQTLPIGQVVSGRASDQHAEVHPVTFRVARQATREEYLTQLDEYGVRDRWRDPGEANYYEVQMD